MSLSCLKITVFCGFTFFIFDCTAALQQKKDMYLLILQALLKKEPGEIVSSVFSSLEHNSETTVADFPKEIKSEISGYLLFPPTKNLSAPIMYFASLLQLYKKKDAKYDLKKAQALTRIIFQEFRRRTVNQKNFLSPENILKINNGISTIRMHCGNDAIPFLPLNFINSFSDEVLYKAANINFGVLFECLRNRHPEKAELLDVMSQFFDPTMPVYDGSSENVYNPETLLLNPKKFLPQLISNTPDNDSSFEKNLQALRRELKYATSFQAAPPYRLQRITEFLSSGKISDKQKRAWAIKQVLVNFCVAACVCYWDADSLYSAIFDPAELFVCSNRQKDTSSLVFSWNTVLLINFFLLFTSNFYRDFYAKTICNAFYSFTRGGKDRFDALGYLLGARSKNSLSVSPAEKIMLLVLVLGAHMRLSLILACNHFAFRRGV